MKNNIKRASVGQLIKDYGTKLVTGPGWKRALYGSAMAVPAVGLAGGLQKMDSSKFKAHAEEKAGQNTSIAKYMAAAGGAAILAALISKMRKGPGEYDEMLKSSAVKDKAAKAVAEKGLGFWRKAWDTAEPHVKKYGPAVGAGAGLAYAGPKFLPSAQGREENLDKSVDQNAINTLLKTLLAGAAVAGGGKLLWHLIKKDPVDSEFGGLSKYSSDDLEKIASFRALFKGGLKNFLPKLRALFGGSAQGKIGGEALRGAFSQGAKGVGKAVAKKPGKLGTAAAFAVPMLGAGYISPHLTGEAAAQKVYNGQKQKMFEKIRAQLGQVPMKEQIANYYNRGA